MDWMPWKKERRKEFDRQRRKGRANRNAEVVRAMKSRPCADCGIQYPYYVMDFDHVRGKKKSNIAKMDNKCASLESLLAEIAKCDVVCANCHRERTHRRSLNCQ